MAKKSITFENIAHGSLFRPTRIEAMSDGEIRIKGKYRIGGSDTWDRSWIDPDYLFDKTKWRVALHD
jgi:hypothetical protein